MSIKDGILVEIERETQNTRSFLNRLSDQHWNYKPHEKSMTLGELASHVVELHNWIHMAIPKNVFDFHTDYHPRKEVNLEELKLELEDGYQKNKEFVKAHTDEFWLENWKLKAGD